MISVNDCFSKVKKDCFKYISSQETKTEKFKNKDRMIKSFLINKIIFLRFFYYSIFKLAK